MAKTKQPKKVKYTWNNTYYWRCYRLALEGMSDVQIAALLGVSPGVFAAWKKKRPSLVAGLREAREEKKALKNNLSGYIFDRLTPESRMVWDRLVTAWEDTDPASREQKLRLVLDGQEDATLKHLFLHALVANNFKISEAMKQVGITQRQVRKWAAADPEFMHAVDEIEYHKKNFFEGKLIDLVDRGEPAAVLMVNRTYNADRGYSTKQHIEVNSTVKHEHSGQVSIDAIAQYLPLDVLEVIHRAVQMVRGGQTPKAIPAGVPEDTAVIDGEIVAAGTEED